MGTLFTCSISANEMSSCASVSATGRGIALDREGGRAINSPPSFHTLASALPLGTPLRPDDDDGACVTQELHRNGGSAGVHLHDLHSSTSTIPVEFLSDACAVRSEEHTSELQSRQYLVCRL